MAGGVKLDDLKVLSKPNYSMIIWLSVVGLAKEAINIFFLFFPPSYKISLCFICLQRLENTITGVRISSKQIQTTKEFIAFIEAVVYPITALHLLDA